MSYVTELVAITPDKPLDPRVFEREAMKALQEINREVRREFKRITDQFSYHTDWQSSYGAKGDEIFAETKTSSTPFVFLGGTSVRHAVMSQDFVPRTTPGSLSVGQKKGRKLFVSRKVRKPGLKDRQYDVQIATKVEPKFYRKLESAFDRASQKA